MRELTHFEGSLVVGCAKNIRDIVREDIVDIGMFTGFFMGGVMGAELCTGSALYSVLGMAAGSLVGMAAVPVIAKGGLEFAFLVRDSLVVSP
ncbi:MAG: hypothetical protein AB7I18_02095 [Candidatus Berkiella sp.]